MSSRSAVPDRPLMLERCHNVCLHLAFWIPLAGCTYLALTPAPPDALFRVSDVILHALAFAYLTFMLGLAFPSLTQVRVAAWMLTYGVLLEGLQSFEPERSAELKDLLVDGVGIAAGMFLLHRLGPWCRELLRRVLGAILAPLN